MRLQQYRFLVKRGLCRIGLGRKPDFLILGAQKAGTTSLFRYISDYAGNFAAPTRKEIQFFTDHYDRGLDYYCAHFPLFARGNKTGEASPTYLFYHKCPQRIHECLPHARFVVLLRNPVERAYSHYSFLNLTDKTIGRDPLSFDQAVRTEEQRFRVEQNSAFFYEYKKHSYKARGRYYEQLRRWLDYFPLDRFLILETDELTREPRKTLQTIFQFLGLRFNSRFQDASFPRYNENVYQQMPEATRHYLEEYFQPFNEQLFELLGRRYDW